jgi:hypothetical protein
LLPEFCEGETLKVTLGDTMFGHHSTQMEPTPNCNSAKNFLYGFVFCIGGWTGRSTCRSLLLIIMRGGPAGT